jgi:radical SAM superfamily enzyme YgiQ (UPF0313 family)
VTPDVPHILFINPWIHDFAAYDFWARPLGLLSLAGILRYHGFAVHYIDCLNRFHPEMQRMKNPVPGCGLPKNGRGPYLKTPIPRPVGFEDVRRTYSRYGIRPEWFLADLGRVPAPDLVLVTTLMTYWYGGVKETISLVRKIFPHAPVLAGGIYATLCPEHAAASLGAHEIFSGPAESALMDLVDQYTGFSQVPRFDPDVLDSYPYPAFDLQETIPYTVLMTSKGCPFSCPYCASKKLAPGRMIRSPDSVLEEIRYWHEKFGVLDFALYDDAFLINPEAHAKPLLEKIASSGMTLRFHTPNALHIREMDLETAVLMKRAGFYTIRLGLETAAFEEGDALDGKVTENHFKRAVFSLKAAGFQREQIGAYLLVGLPFERQQAVSDSIAAVKAAGITPVPAYYSPIPGTGLWPKAVIASRYDLQSDPLYTNNAVFPCRKEPFTWEWITALKKQIAA